MSSQRIMEIAKEIANTQAALGNSPAEVGNDGTIVLCAASCVAKAAIVAAQDTELLADFEARVVNEDKYTYLTELFRTHNLEMDPINIIQENDSRPPEQRLDWFNRL